MAFIQGIFRHNRAALSIFFHPATIAKGNNGQQGNRINDVAKRNGSLFVTWKPELGWYVETGLTLVLGDQQALVMTGTYAC